MCVRAHIDIADRFYVQMERDRERCVMTVTQAQARVPWLLPGTCEEEEEEEKEGREEKK